MRTGRAFCFRLYVYAGLHEQLVGQQALFCQCDVVIILEKQVVHGHVFAFVCYLVPLAVACVVVQFFKDFIVPVDVLGDADKSESDCTCELGSDKGSLHPSSFESE